MIDWSAFDAVLFDLDGVLTATAHVHERCWKRVFDEYLSSSVASHENRSRPFELPRTTNNMLTASCATMVFAHFCRREESGSLMEHLLIPRQLELYVV